MSDGGLELIAVPGIGEVSAGESIAELIAGLCAPAASDVVCISQKIVSKAEGRGRDLDAVIPSKAARHSPTSSARTRPWSSSSSPRAGASSAPSTAC